jgi:hypothetical protein
MEGFQGQRAGAVWGVRHAAAVARELRCRRLLRSSTALAAGAVSYEMIRASDPSLWYSLAGRVLREPLRIMYPPLVRVYPRAQVNVMPTPDGRFAVSLTELATGSYVLDMDTLGTRGPIRYRDRVKGSMTTAHPSVQPDGSLVQASPRHAPRCHG